MEVATANPAAFPRICRIARRAADEVAQHGRIELFQCDIPLPQMYCFDRGVFPAALCRVTADGTGRIGSLSLRDDAWTTDYLLPPLRWMEVRLAGADATADPSHRFVGVFTNGEAKVRGIELRRRDFPLFVRDAQAAMLAVLQEARTAGELRRLAPRAVEVFLGSARDLASGKVPLAAPAIGKRLSKDLRAYRKDTLPASAAHTLLARGVRLEPGETVEYVITNFRDPAKGRRAAPFAAADGTVAYDVEKYLDLLAQAARRCWGFRAGERRNC